MEEYIVLMEEALESLPSYRASYSLSIDRSIIRGQHEAIPFEEGQVKIIPGKIVFHDAFDGKQFKKSFTIINCGKRPAFIRMMTPTSQAFKMKPLKRGKYIASGLSVTRTIHYTHTSAMALNQACLFIYINEKPITYQLEVNLISTYVVLTPKVLNFGEIDVGNASEQLSIKLKNLGRRIAQFSIDLGRNDLELIVDPMKGTILPDEEINVKVEVLGSQVGSFNKEFWVKTEPPRRITITGVFIAPKVVIANALSTFNLTLVEFPRTYYGAESVRTVVITNSSSTDRMFCLVSERGKEFDCLADTATRQNLRCFSMNSVEGRLLARQHYILRFTFTPLKLEFSQKYGQVFIRVMEVNYRDGAVAESEVNVKTFTSSANVEEYLATPIDNLQEFDDIKIPQSFFARLCLYGEMEEPCVKIHPEDFTLSYLNVDETYDRIVNISNGSQHLPIIFRSNIVACIKVYPPNGLLGPGKSLEITISITPSEEGVRTYKLIFDLIHHDLQKEYKVGTAVLPVKFSATMIYPKVQPEFNMGITPKVTHEVGFLVDDVTFNSKIDKPRQAIVDKNYKSFNKKNTDLIAFPNDMPKCLRPWKSKTPCRTIFSNMPRVVSDQDEYTLTVQEVESKNHNNKIYSDYLERRGATRRRLLTMTEIVPAQDYDLTEKSHLLLEKLEPSESIAYQPNSPYSFIPLPPSKLMNVIIKPKYVYLGKIAPYTTCTDSFTIENKNEFSIHVSIKALSNSVVIKEKNRIIIQPNKTRNIFFDCFSHGFGKFYVPVYIIVNANHVFDGTVFASVVPTTVKCDQKDIIINPKTHKSFFELFNPVNCDIKFSWEIQDKNFGVVPESGVIPSRKSVFCSVSFYPQIDATFKTEMYLLSQSGAKQIVPVSCRNDRASIGFSTDAVKFDNIPLNIEVKRQIVLRNFANEEIMYLVENPNPLDEITVRPTVGKINAKSDIDLTITVLFTNITAFNCSLRFTMQDEYYYTVAISGNVVFPSVNIVPQNIQIAKVPAGSYQRHNFRMTNTSAARNMITFHLEDIPEFAVMDEENKPLLDGITLEPDEVRDMILVFKPTEPVAYSLYFPYKMNHMIGPPLLNDPSSLRPESYFRRAERGVHLKTTVDGPKTIRTLSIRCAASTPWFRFSSLSLVFHYENRGRCKKRFAITNISATEHRLVIPFVNPEYPFILKLDKKTDHQPSDDSWNLVVEPNESISFKIEYAPSEFGECTVELPIYVEEYPRNEPFNYLQLSGSYSSPTITCQDKLLYFQAITVKERITRKVILELNFHKRDCVVSLDIYQHAALSVRALKRSQPGRASMSHYNSVAEYLIKFDPKSECILHAPITFTCSCGASYEIIVRASADNCIFCSYQSFIKARAIAETGKFESTYPFFPLPSNKSFYGNTVMVIKEDIEGWLFSQGFFYMAFYKIPYGMARFPVNVLPRSESDSISIDKPQPQVLPLVQLLINLVDPNVTKYFDVEGLKPCYEDVQGVVYAYRVYKNILKFLEFQGVFVAQLKPEHLLPYYKYVIFKESICTEDSSIEKTLTADDFLYFTKQAWLDLILRIYRVFVYNRATNPFAHPKIRTSVRPLIYAQELIEYCAKHFGEFSDDVNESEAKLMLWLEFHFENQRFVLWDEETNSKMPKKKIRSFEHDLADSLPFATLMMAYCPYMRKCFDNFFPLYQNEEDIYHNGCIIYETWKRLHLSYDLRPIRIVKSSATEMEILVTYLYDVLPNFYPSETITFNASLGEISINKIVLRNQGDAVIAYTPLFFLNDSEVFEVDSGIITITPGGTRNLHVTYKAKSILKKTAVLVLSGETIGYKFCKTIAFNLVGIPDIFKFTEEYTRRVEVSKQVNATWDLMSPFDGAYEAKLYLFLGDQTKTPESLDEFISISTFKTDHVPTQLCLDPECHFDEDSETQIKLRMCYVACGSYTYFLYFLNKDVGDFCAKIQINAVLRRSATNLNVYLPRKFSIQDCICGPRAMDMKCPRMIFVDIPCKNQILIDGLVMMFRNCAGDEEFNFWRPLLDYPKGFHVLKEYIENTFEDIIVPFKALLHLQVTYDVRITHSKKLTTAKKIKVGDVSCSDTFRLEIHWNSNEYPEKEQLHLTADHGQEMRIFNLVFIQPEKLFKDDSFR